MNVHHIEVKVCCASCQHKEVENDGSRVCQEMELKVTQGFVCPKWQMSDGVENAGMSGGVIKKLTEVIIK